MAELLFRGIFALAALAILGLAVAVVRRYPPVGIGLICIILFTVWDVPNPPPIFTFAGLSVYPADVITLVLLVVALLEISQLRANMQGWLIPWGFFAALAVVSLLRGIAYFGAGTAVNEARPTVHFLCAMSWVLAVRPERLRLYTVSLVVGWGLVFVAAYHGVRYGVGGSSSVANLGEELLQTGRVLYGGQAAALLLCAAMVLLSPPGSARVRPQFVAVSSIVFLALVVLAQHRSVWSAAALGAIMVLIWSGRKQARNRVFVFFVIGVWIGLIVWTSGILDSSRSGLFDAAFDMGTYEWRTSSWRSLLSDAIAKGSEVIAVGEPFGSGYWRQIYDGRWTDRAAHNWYVTNFLRLGIIGVATLALMLIAALVKSRSGPAWSTFVLAASATYSWAYQLDWYLTPWLGAAMVVSFGAAGGRLATSAHTAPRTLPGGAPKAVRVAGSSIP